MIYVNQIFSLSQVTSANYELLQCSSFTTEQCGWVPRNRCRNEKKHEDPMFSCQFSICFNWWIDANSIWNMFHKMKAIFSRHFGFEWPKKWEEPTGSPCVGFWRLLVQMGGFFTTPSTMSKPWWRRKCLRSL